MSIKDQAQAGPSKSAESREYIIGDRYLNVKNNQPITIRYIGSLPPTLTDSTSSSSSQKVVKGEQQLKWIGIEYDDPSFGKHSGTYNNIQIFDCRSCTPNSTPAAFIKLSSAATTLRKGKMLIEAIEDRYGSIIPPLDEHNDTTSHIHEGNTDERGVLGSSNGAINVEMPNMDRVRKRVGQLEKLRNMGFDTDYIYALDRSSGTGDQGEGEIWEILRKRLKGVKWLNLSRNLLPSWKAVAEIINLFQGLEVLSLNYSRFEPPDTLSSSELETIRPAFENIIELHISASLLSWEEICRISYLFPNVQTLHLEDNPLALNLRQAKTPSGHFRNLRELNLARCHISSWTEIVSALVDLPLLENLDLSWTDLRSIPPPSSIDVTPQIQMRFIHLRQLNLHHTLLKGWNDIDNLDEWTCGTLTSLKLSRRNIILNDDNDDNTRKVEVERGITGRKLDRSIIIGKMSNLQIFNSTNISEGERRDSEMYYLSFVERSFREPLSLSSAKEEEKKVREDMWVWKKYKTLCEKYSREPISLSGSGGERGGDKPNVKKAGSTGLQSKMITINLIAAPGTSLTIPSDSPTISILPTSSKTLLVRKAAKIIGIDPKILRLWNVKVTDSNTGKVHVPVVHITDPWDKKDVGWWLDNEDYVMCCTEDELESVRLIRDYGEDGHGQ